MDIPFCLGCNQCLLKGEDKCPHFKKIKVIEDAMKKADGIIIASSAYSLGINAVLKNMIDHLSYNFHRPGYSDKKGLIITSAAGTGQRQVAKYLKVILGHWNFNKIFSHSIISGVLAGFKPNKRQQAAFYKTADRFVEDVKSKKMHSPSINRLFYFGVWKAMAKNDDAPDSADRKFWVDNDMMDIAYHRHVPLSGFKRNIGNMLFKIMDRVFKRNMKKNI